MSQSSQDAQHARVLWQVHVDYPIGNRPLPLADGVVVPLVGTSGTALRRIEVRDGATRWETVLEGASTGSIGRTGRLIVAALSGGRLARLHLSDGSEIGPEWRTEGELGDPVIARRGRAYARLTRDGFDHLVAFEDGRSDPRWIAADPLDGRERGRAALMRETLVLAAPLDSPGGERDGGYNRVAGIDLDDGLLLWRNDKLRGHVSGFWHVAGLLDLFTDDRGIFALNRRTGKVRNRRFVDFPFIQLVPAGESALALNVRKGHPMLFCYNSVGQRVSGRVLRPMKGIVGAHAGEALVRDAEGKLVLYALPGLLPVEFPEASLLGDVTEATWSRDVAYLVSADRRTLTAVDLDAPPFGA